MMRDQFLHTLAAISCLLPIALFPNVPGGALSGLLIGAYRELGQMTVTGDLRWGKNRTIDTLFHGIGGAALGLLL